MIRNQQEGTPNPHHHFDNSQKSGWMEEWIDSLWPEGRSQRVGTPSGNLDAAFLLTARGFLLTVELLCLQLELWSFFAYDSSSFTYNWSFFTYD